MSKDGRIFVAEVTFPGMHSIVGLGISDMNADILSVKARTGACDAPRLSRGNRCRFIVNLRENGISKQM